VWQIEVCGSSISATRPVPVPDDAYRTRTRPVPTIAIRPDPTRGYTRTRSLPVGLPLLGIIRLVALPPGPDHYIALVLMNLFSVVENMSCMHHHHNRPIDCSIRVPGKSRPTIRLRYNIRYSLICGL